MLLLILLRQVIQGQNELKEAVLRFRAALFFDYLCKNDGAVCIFETRTLAHHGSNNGAM